MLLIVNSDVTIFFMISGFLFEKNFEKYVSDKKSFIKKKFWQLIIPYLFWNLVLYVSAWFVHSVVGGQISVILNTFGFTKLTWANIVVNILTYTNYYVEYLWFIYVLFLLFLINILVGRKANRLWFGIFILCFAAALNHYFELPYIVWKLLQHYSSFLIGRVVFNYISLKKIHAKEAMAISFGVICSALITVGVVQTLMQKNIIRALIVTLSNFGLHVAVGIFLYLLSSVLVKLKMGNKMSQIGDFSYDIYLMHTPYVVPIIAKALSRIIGIWSISFLLTVICGITIPYAVSKYIIRRSSILKKAALGK